MSSPLLTMICLGTMETFSVFKVSIIVHIRGLVQPRGSFFLSLDLPLSNRPVTPRCGFLKKLEAPGSPAVFIFAKAKAKEKTNVQLLPVRRFGPLRRDRIVHPQAVRPLHEMVRKHHGGRRP